MPTYVAILRKAPDSDYGVEFPDVPGCISAGADLDEARQMGAEALAFHLEGLREDGDPVPAPSSRAEIEAQLDDTLRGDDFYGLLDIEI